MKRFLTIGLLIAGGLVVAAVATSATQSDSGGREPEIRERSGGDDLSVTVTPEMRRHSRIRNVLYFVGTAWQFGALLLVLGSGLSRRMRDWVSFLPNSTLRAMAYVSLFVVVTTVLTFPLAVYSGFVVPHQFDLSNQTLAQWLVEGAKELMVGILVSAPVGALALWGIRMAPKRWWLLLWAGGIPLSIFLVVLSPLLIEPLFNDFRPMANRGLEARLLDMASLAGIEGADVFEVDKSRQTKTMNAYVTGLGPSKRIVIWDTLLSKMSDDEVLFVMGHEMGHYVMNHIWKGLAFGGAVMFGVLWIGRRVMEWGVLRFGPIWGFSEPHDPAAVPWLLLVVSGFLFVLSPALSGYSRMVEHDADVFALELTHLNEDGARAFIKFAEDSKVDPEPHPFIEIWRYSHPPLARRIEFALSYRPWDQGLPNKRWTGSSRLAIDRDEGE